MKVTEALYTQLSDVALVAARHGFLAEADQILDCLIHWVPTDDRAILAKAISRIYLNEANEAATILKEKVLSKDAGHPYARGFLGFAYKMGGFSNEGNRELRNLIAENEHPTVVEFAISLIEDPFFDSIEPAYKEVSNDWAMPMMYC